MITERIDAITRISATHMGTQIQPPKSCKIEITAHCNYACKFCVKSIRTESGEMDRAFYSRMVKECRAAGVEEWGVFYIGESFTCSWLPDAIAEAKAAGFPYVFLTTNGAAAAPHKVKACFDAGLDSLKFSLNFYSPQQLRDVAQVGPSHWRAAIANLKAARRIRDEGDYKCGLFASSIAFDGEQGKLMQALVDEVRPLVDEHYWLPLYGMSGASAAAGWKPRPGNPGRLDNMREPLPCWAAFTEAHITHDGKLAACCFGSGLDGGLVMADLHDVDFMTGWNSPAFQELRAAHLLRDVRGTACETCAAA